MKKSTRIYMFLLFFIFCSFITLQSIKVYAEDNVNDYIPGTVEVQTDKGIRIDRIDRPSNKTPGDEGIIIPHKTIQKDTLTSEQIVPNSVVDPNIYITCPSKIRVGIRPNNNSQSAIAYVESVTFDSTSNLVDSYVKDVLPYEWEPTWTLQSLKAGAMAVKMYGWYHVLVPLYPAIGADVCNSNASQVFKHGGYNVSQTSQAIDSIHGLGYCKEDRSTYNAYLFETAYRAGSYDAQTTYGIMSQNGTHYLADNGWAYDEMLDYYYDDYNSNVVNYFFFY